MAVVVSSSNRKKHRQVSFLSMLLIFIIVATIAFVLGNDFSSSKLEDSNPELIDATKDAESKTKNISKAITEETSNKQTNKNDNAQPKASTQTTTTDKSSNITQVQEDNTSTITKDNEKPKKDIPQFPVEIKHFDNEVDNQLEIVSRKNFGSFFTPFVDMTDEEALAYLQAPIQIFETDDEKKFTMATKDLNMAKHIKDMIEIGVISLKVEPGSYIEDTALLVHKEYNALFFSSKVLSTLVRTSLKSSISLNLSSSLITLKTDKESSSLTFTTIDELSSVASIAVFNKSLGIVI